MVYSILMSVPTPKNLEIKHWVRASHWLHQGCSCFEKILEAPNLIQAHTKFHFVVVFFGSVESYVCSSMKSVYWFVWYCNEYVFRRLYTLWFRNSHSIVVFDHLLEIGAGQVHEPIPKHTFSSPDFFRYCLVCMCGVLYVSCIGVSMVYFNKFLSVCHFGSFATIVMLSRWYLESPLSWRLWLKQLNALLKSKEQLIFNQAAFL